MNRVSANRLVLVAALLFLLAALMVALSVVPAVKADMSPNANPARAVTAFRVNAGLNLLLSASCCAIAVRGKERTRVTTAVLVLLGIVALLLGLALVDAAGAFRSHEMPAQGASVYMLVCAAADLLAGVIVIFAAFRRPQKVKAA